MQVNQLRRLSYEAPSARYTAARGVPVHRPFAVALTSPWIADHEVATSILVYGEVNEYILGQPNYAVFHARLMDVLEAIPLLPITSPIMRRYGEIRRTLRRTNSLIGDIDTVIAATALEENLTVVTADRDFQRVPDLTLMLVPRGQLAR